MCIADYKANITEVLNSIRATVIKASDLADKQEILSKAELAKCLPLISVLTEQVDNIYNYLDKWEEALNGTHETDQDYANYLDSSKVYDVIDEADDAKSMLKGKIAAAKTLEELNSIKSNIRTRTSDRLKLKQRSSVTELKANNQPNNNQTNYRTNVVKAKDKPSNAKPSQSVSSVHSRTKVREVPELSLCAPGICESKICESETCVSNACASEALPLNVSMSEASELSVCELEKSVSNVCESATDELSVCEVGKVNPKALESEEEFVSESESVKVVALEGHCSQQREFDFEKPSFQEPATNVGNSIITQSKSNVTRESSEIWSPSKVDTFSRVYTEFSNSDTLVKAQQPSECQMTSQSASPLPLKLKPSGQPVQNSKFDDQPQRDKFNEEQFIWSKAFRRKSTQIIHSLIGRITHKFLQSKVTEFGKPFQSH
jgi:hypothetical protein